MADKLATTPLHGMSRALRYGSMSWQPAVPTMV
jgi:hypothetical protein